MNLVKAIKPLNQGTNFRDNRFVAAKTPLKGVNYFSRKKIKIKINKTILIYIYFFKFYRLHFIFVTQIFTFAKLK